MWDITWLKTDVRGIYYYAYVIEDLYDRSSGWMPPHPAFFVKKSVYEKYGLFRLDCGIMLASGDYNHYESGENRQN